jgi:hypothetical protein
LRVASFRSAGWGVFSAVIGDIVLSRTFDERVR